MTRSRISRILVVCLLIVISATVVSGQDAVPLECGDIIEAELTPSENQHNYILQVPPGTELMVDVEPIGATMNPYMRVYDSGNNGLGSFNSAAAGEIELLRDLVVASSNPRLNIFGARRTSSATGSSNDRPGASLGAYILYFGCVLRNGTVVNAGDSEVASNAAGNAPVESAFSGFGFPGLAPVDFSQVARLAIPAGVPMSGAVTTNGSEILGYLFNANAGDTVELSFTRLSGNLNLGLVVINANSDIIFQSSLVTTDSLTTRFKVPGGGEYTAGMFRLDLLPPANPEATAFQVKVVVNPE